ncbi:phosphatidate cytidylyltransferase [Candidatus Spongiihabitans sp.]|uniref:phosphatidate cytidylyltransferase n=1 Tax=Candidatus Spongiihabitans sp. TaxID=3101308 RepID=UPI003C6F3CFC
MLVRIITVLVLAPVVILLTLTLSTHWFSVFLLAVTLMGLYEWNRLTIKSSGIFSIAAIGLAVAAWWLVSQPKLLFAICALAALFWAYQIYALQQFGQRFNRSQLSGSVSSSASGSKCAFPLGVFCLLAAWAALVLLHQQTEQGPIATIALLVMVWAADSFAYFTGKAFGRNRLAPGLSPNKTVEGVIGGLFGSFLIAGLFGFFVLDFSSDILSVWMAAGLCAAVFSVVGDLYESRLKRLAGVKDSGHLLPGHGGVLDRIDGVIAATPVFATLVFMTPVFIMPGKWPL